MTDARPDDPISFTANEKCMHGRYVVHPCVDCAVLAERERAEADEQKAVELALRQGERCRNYGPDHERTENENCIVVLADEVVRSCEAVGEEKRRSFQATRICYGGFSYGVGSQWGIDSLRQAIKANGHD